MANLFPDLFEAPKIPGLSYREDILSHNYQLRLIAGIDATALEPFRFRAGWQAPGQFLCLAL